MQPNDKYIMSDEEKQHRINLEVEYTIRKGETALQNLSNLLNTMMSNALCLNKMGVRDSFGLRTSEVLQVLINEMHKLTPYEGTTDEENHWLMKKYVSAIYRIRRKANTLADIIGLPKYKMTAEDLLLHSGHN